MKINKNITHALAIAALLTPQFATRSFAQDVFQMVGSSTVYPFSTVVAERYSQIFDKPAPKVESTGTGGGMKLFCSGQGPGTPDLTGASRRIKASELSLCVSNNAGGIIELLIGYDGIVVAQNKTAAKMKLSRTQIFMALARKLPRANGRLESNPNRKWSDISPELPDIAIRVYGPPPTSGTRDSFVELVMETGCEGMPGFEAMAEIIGKQARKAACASFREDGVFIEAGENDNLILQRLASNPNTLGIFGYSLLEANEDSIRGMEIDGSTPSFEAITDGAYPVSRPLYVYVKSAHIENNPELAEFVAFFVSEDAIGSYGFLAERGLIPLSSAELAENFNAVEKRIPLDPARF